jgi:hypothetical protein
MRKSGGSGTFEGFNPFSGNRNGISTRTDKRQAFALPKRMVFIKAEKEEQQNPNQFEQNYCVIKA